MLPKMELFTTSSWLTKKEWNELKTNTNETITLREKISLMFIFFFNFCFNFFLTNKIFQDWIKEIYLESRAEIKLIVVFFCSESMTFVFSHSIHIAR